MADAHEASRGDIRVELESIRRDIGCLMQDMRQVKTVLFKLRGLAAESLGEEKVDAASRGAEEKVDAASRGAEEKVDAASRGAEERVDAASRGAEEKVDAASRGAEEKVDATSRGAEEKADAASWGAEEKVDAASSGAEEKSLKTPPARMPDVQELGDVYHLGKRLKDEAGQRGGKKEGGRRACSNSGSCAVGDEGSTLRRGPAILRVDDLPRRRSYERRTTNADEVRVADYLPGSVYVWACGEKLDPSDKDVTSSDMMIGWLTLLVQVSAYVVLITGAEDNDEDATYSIYSIFLAMFLMLSISSSDIRASHALLFWGGSWGRWLFGAVLLGCNCLLVTASLRVLFMDAENNAELVIGAATVLFIEDVDNKVATFLKSVPRKWRLFWMLEILGASFWIAVAGVIEFGNSNAVLDKDFRDLDVHLQEVVGTEEMYSVGWGLTMWALFLNCVANHKPRTFQDSQRMREASVLPLARESVPRDSAHLHEPKKYQELLLQGFCLAIVFVVLFVDIFRMLFLLRFVYYAAISLLFAGALRGVLGSCGTCPWRGTPGPPQFTWYRVFVGWALGTFLYFVYVSGGFLPSNCLPVVEKLLMALDLLLIVEPTFFGKWGGNWIRSLQRFLMTKNGYIYWMVFFHVMYWFVWWTISAPFFMIYVFH